MTAAELNETLRREAPAAHACLSPLGRAAVYPDGVPAQGADARECLYNAVTGQVTDGHGNPLALDALASHLVELDPRMSFLYSGQGGAPALRDAWADRLRGEGGDLPFSRPQVTAGLTNGLALAADLFADAETDVLVPRPGWENYEAIFGLRRGARLRSYDLFDAEQRFSGASLRRALAEGATKKVLVLNFPGNPTGYAPRRAEVDALVRVVTGHAGPLVVVMDDAYHGFVWEPGVPTESLFWSLVREGDPARVLPVKVDGATKELLFFGGRIGFLTFGCGGAAADALQWKALAIARGTISSLPGPSQGIVLAALRDPALSDQAGAVKRTLQARFRVLRDALQAAATKRLRPYPANAGCFQLVGLPADLDAHETRRRLIADQSVGLLAIPEVNALRIAFCSMDEERIPELVRRLAAVVG